MRIEILFTDRVGIAHEVLAVLARRSINVTAVEVDPPRIYIEAPTLDESGLRVLREDLIRIADVRSVAAVNIMPGVQRRLHLDALLASQPDPVIAIDADGRVVLVNDAAIAAIGLESASLLGRPVSGIIGTPALLEALIEGGYHLAVREVEINHEPYMLESLPLHEPGGPAAGAVLSMHAPSRIGERLSALQNYTVSRRPPVAPGRPPGQAQ